MRFLTEIHLVLLEIHFPLEFHLKEESVKENVKEDSILAFTTTKQPPLVEDAFKPEYLFFVKERPTKDSLEINWFLWLVEEEENFHKLKRPTFLFFKLIAFDLIYNYIRNLGLSLRFINIIWSWSFFFFF